MYKIVTALGSVVSIMNIFAGIIGGIWLIILGKWALPVIGLIATLLVLNLIFPLLFLPGLAIQKFALTSLEMRRKMPYGFLQLIYWTINVAWMTAFVLIAFAVVFRAGTGAPIIPLALLAYGLTAGPLGELTVNESDENPTKMLVLLLDLGAAIICFAMIFGMPVSGGLLIMLPIALLCLAWGMISSFAAWQMTEGQAAEFE